MDEQQIKAGQKYTTGEEWLEIDEIEVYIRSDELRVHINITWYDENGEATGEDTMLGADFAKEVKRGDFRLT